ncbi:hypothetical protein BEL04_17515 [Mucilaginibacter sp. PPCGB 2223]|uniref:ankyrin repeat domain-containing protein n=1 Tax=Mucilaginibacter sp. PPCGB 2223 TaxID=1886027 RepID=UPI0008261B0C|nr:ankyrin repeat domain-containing protein [Mucilaginibacter sp. PPCGB 2223]OCX51810.1 hypothetical protein BEL04_17515 [Mucilaginibacter sp. PPCGB 2223]
MAEIPVDEKEKADLAAQFGDEAAVTAFLEKFRGHLHFSAPWYAEAGCDWSEDAAFNARQLIKHKHWFDTWEDYADFRTRLKTDTQLHQFELAADAIAGGDITTLRTLVNLDPDLISMRSPRGHHSTLLNYVGANGIEGWRQKTPQNAAAIAQVLLDAGAEVDAWGDMYGGTSTLGLVATSVHPVKAGVQEELMDVLIGHGADPNHAVAPTYTHGLLILACIHNGRYEPIHYLARHGAVVDLEAAGALGDLDKVKSLFAGSPAEKRALSLCWACQYGHTPVVHFLLGQGLSVNTFANGTTPLLSAAFDGQLELVKELLARGADMEAQNDYGGTALGQTLWCLYNHRKPAHLEIMEILLANGAKVNDDWQFYIDDQRS